MSVSLRARELRDEGLDRGVRDLAHLVVGAVLDRVWREDPGGGVPERCGLGFGGVDETLGGHEDPRDTAPFKVADVVHTARRAAASIGERLDHRIARCGDLVAKIDRCGLGEGRLHEAGPTHRDR